MKRISIALMVTALFLLAVSPTGYAQTIYVPDDFATIQAALDAADDLYTIVVRDGVYTGPGNKDLDFNGKALTLRSENGPENCIIDCEGSYVNEGRGFYFHSGETTASVVDGFTITNGYASWSDRGGGISCRGSSPTISNCIVTNNTSYTGGGIYCENSSPSILNCTISGNSIKCDMSNIAGGGGIGCFQSSPAIVNCMIVGNSTDLHGGGILSKDSSPYIASCNILGNTAGSMGGGLYCDNSPAIIIDCKISGNSTRQGGGICFAKTFPFRCNSETGGNNFGRDEFDNSPGSAAPVVVNCILTGNGAFECGGAIVCNKASPGIIHCTISGNRALMLGGGVCAIFGASPYIADSILWNDFSTNGREIAVAPDIGLWIGQPSSLAVGYSNIKGGRSDCFVAEGSTLNWGFGNIDADPVFVVSGSWKEGEWVDGDYHLGSLSPCIDTGIGFGVFSDFDDDNRPIGMGYDIGADEFRSVPNRCPVLWGARLEPSGGNTRTIFRFTANYYDENGDRPITVTAVVDGVPRAMSLLSGSAANGTYYLDTRLGAGFHTYHFICVDMKGCDARLPDFGNYKGPFAKPATAFYVPDDYPTIQAALDDCIDGETIIVRDGIYTGPRNKNLDFRGKAIALRSENGPENCIIDCEADGRGFHFHRNEGRGSIVSGFTITNGYVTSVEHSAVGGAVYCDDSSPAIINCIVKGNAADSGGGVSCRHAASPILSKCVFTNNIAENFGGGIEFEGMSLDIGKECLISECIISGNSANQGGGILCGDASITITACAVEENSAESNGGGILALNSEVTIVDTMIAANSTNSSGGGLDSVGSITTIANCVIANNSANDDGGGIAATTESSLNLSNCTIGANVANQYGGGISADFQASVSISNCILTDNLARQGNALALLQGSSSTISFSDIHGEGESSYVENDSTLIIGTGLIFADPLFVSGPLGDYYLSQRTSGQDVTSPCVNAGSGTAVGAGMESYTTRTDEVGDTGRVDMGYHYPGFVAGELSHINCTAPANETAADSSPTFSWTADGGTNNAFVVDIAVSLHGPMYTSPAIQGETYWTMPQQWWDAIPSGSFVYWRVRGADLDATPLSIIYSDEIWWFYKP